MEEDKTICYCSNVKETQIIKELQNGAKNISDIRKRTGACTIGRCKELSPYKK